MAVAAWSLSFRISFSEGSGIGRATCVSGHPWHCRPTTGASDGNPTAWAGGRSHKPIFSKRLLARDRARGQV